MNAGPGNVAIAFPTGMTYVPGTRQRWTITVTDPTQRVFGFQASARLESNLSAGQAGTFRPVDSRTAVLCDDGSLRETACRANFTVEFIQHTGANNTNTFTVEWDPPATNVGNVRVYVAGNAANGNNTNSGDRIYTASYTLTPATGGGTGNAPTIAASGVAEAFNFTQGTSPNSWTVIAGTNLSTGTRDWGSFTGNQLPTTLDGVSVTVGGRPAAVYFISPTQINILTPPDVTPGPQAVVVTNAAGSSAPASVTIAAQKPAFYAPFAEGGTRFFVTAVALDGTYVGKRGLDPRVTRGARPGEVLLVFATGFGATTPAVPPNTIPTGAPAISMPVRVLFGQTVATIAGNGNLVSPGLYQFNVTVPATLQSGDIALTAEVGGVTSSNSVFLTIERP